MYVRYLTLQVQLQPNQITRAQRAHRSLAVNCNLLLDTDHAQISWLHLGERDQKLRHEWHKILDGVRMRSKQHDAHRPTTQVLLKSQILVDRHERIKLAGDAIKHRPVVDVRCAEVCAHRRHVVSRNEPRETFGHTRVEEDLQVQPLRSAGDGLAQERLTCKSEHRHGVLSRYRGKIGEELRQRMAALDVINERPHRDTSPCKAGFAPEAFRVGRDERYR